MLSWSRPDPLTRDLIHLINARRHDHGDTDAAIDTLQAFIEQGREQDLLTVLAVVTAAVAVSKRNRAVSATRRRYSTNSSAGCSR